MNPMPFPAHLGFRASGLQVSADAPLFADDIERFTRHVRNAISTENVEETKLESPPLA